MNKIHHYVLPILLATSGSPPALSQDEWPPHQALEARYQALLQEEAIVGFNVGIVADGALVFAEAYGVAEIGTGDKLTPDSVFHWASVSKPLVAVAIMQLAEAGKLSLDDPVTEHVPFFSMADPRAKDITLRQLLTHTSGMPDVEDYEWDRPQHDPEALWRWIREQSDRELLFTPGTDREYSNIGFELLGLVIEMVAEESFEDYMAAHLFGPLQMRTSSFIASEIPSELRVKGHVGDPERRVAAHYPYNRRHAPSSTLNSSIVDMANFAWAMLNGGAFGSERILTPESMKEMWSSAWSWPDDPNRLSGLGWNLGLPWGGIFAASHGGQDDGFRSFLYLAPARDVGIFLVSNDQNAPVRLIMRAALEAAFPVEAQMLLEGSAEDGDD
jgi:CubicO group peptidase (beta-lactamase class C family)